MATNLRFAGLALMFAVAMLSPIHAQAAEPQRGVWIVSTAKAPMGTLTLRDGKLTFRTTTAADSWEVDLSDTKRVELSKTTADAIEIENGWGNTYVVKILNARLTPESPSKAYKMIAVAKSDSVKGAATASAATDSVKVVRLNGGQIR